MFEKRIVQFMVQIRDYNVEKASAALLEVCQLYRPGIAPWNCAKAFCVIAHGLYILSSAILPAQDFVRLEIPKHPMFQEDFALWILGQTDQGTEPGVWVEYPEEVPWASRILERPCAIPPLEQPFLNDPRPYSNMRNQWMANGPRWVEDFADELWEAGIGHEWKYHE